MELGSVTLKINNQHTLICEARFFCEQNHSHQKRRQKRKLTIFGNTKQVIQDYDTVFANSIPFRKNDPLQITYLRIPDVTGLHFVPWHRAEMATPLVGYRADALQADAGLAGLNAHFLVKGIPRPNSRGGFIEPNKTVVK